MSGGVYSKFWLRVIDAGTLHVDCQICDGLVYNSRFDALPTVDHLVDAIEAHMKAKHLPTEVPR